MGDVLTISSTGGTNRPHVSPEGVAQTNCPRAYRGQMVDPATGEVFWRRCRSLRCPFCLPIQARQRAAAAALAAPTHFLTLTRTGPAFPAIRRAMNRFRECCCRLGSHFEWFWAAEGNPRRSGTHVHGWLRLTVGVDVEVAHEAAGRAGLGPVLELAEAKGPMGARGGRLEGVDQAVYVLKETLTGPAGGLTLTASQDKFLELNGGRLGHASRGFWTDRFGRRLPGVREAERQADRLQPFQRSTAPGTGSAGRVNPRGAVSAPTHDRIPPLGRETASLGAPLRGFSSFEPGDEP